MIKSITAIVIAVGIASGCSLVGVSGSGPVMTEVRTLGAFTRIDASYGLTVDVQIGSTQDVQVRAQSNILPLITTTSDGGTLRIAATSTLAASTEVVVSIVVPTLDTVTVSGGVNANIIGLASSALAANLSGGAVLTASGAVEAMTTNTSGGSRAQLRQLAVVTMVVDASGGSVIEAQVSAEVRGSASGGARVSVSGDAVLNVEASGGANVERR